MNKRLRVDSIIVSLVFFNLLDGEDIVRVGEQGISHQEAARLSQLCQNSLGLPFAERAGVPTVKR